MNRRSVGTEYESRACEYLESAGIRVLERNFRSRRGEIDIVALDGDTLVFAEVKYRTTNVMGYPQEAVTAAKQRTIMNTARVYLMMRGLPETTLCRFDVIACFADGEIRHFANAFGGM